MSTQPIERHVRVCPQHHVPITEDQHGRMVCPTGWHPIRKFVVVDRLKRSAVVADVDLEVMTDMAIEKPSIVPVPKTATKKLEVLQVAKFTDPAGAVLFIHLRRERTARNGDVFTVKWSRQEPGAGKPGETGVLARETYAEKGREHFAAAKKQALADGWTEALIMAHVAKFAPLPKPAKKGR